MDFVPQSSDLVQQPSPPTHLPVNLIHGPTIPPLNFEVIASSHEETHGILEKVVDDLSQWLSVVEVGLNQILDVMGEEWTVEEEQGLGDEAPSLDIDSDNNTSNTV